MKNVTDISVIRMITLTEPLLYHHGHLFAHMSAACEGQQTHSLIFSHGRAVYTHTHTDVKMFWMHLAVICD